MTEITRVPLQPLAKGSLAKLWLGVAGAVALAAGIAWAAMPEGVSVETVTAGTGPNPQISQVVFVNMTGTLEDGTVFQPPRQGGWPVRGILPDGEPMLYDESLIPGFREALSQMQVGGKYKVEIPSDMAYGATPPPGAPIPPNADLNFDIELVAVMSRAEAEEKFQQMQAQVQRMQAEGGAAPGGPSAPPAPTPQPTPEPAQP